MGVRELLLDDRSLELDEYEYWSEELRSDDYDTSLADYMDKESVECVNHQLHDLDNDDHVDNLIHIDFQSRVRVEPDYSNLIHSMNQHSDKMAKINNLEHDLLISPKRVITADTYRRFNHFINDIQSQDDWKYMSVKSYNKKMYNWFRDAEVEYGFNYRRGNNLRNRRGYLQNPNYRRFPRVISHGLRTSINVIDSERLTLMNEYLSFLSQCKSFVTTSNGEYISRLSVKMNQTEPINGRLYIHPIQNISGIERKLLMIDGKRIVEEDFTSLHPSLLYLITTGYTPDHDIYKLDGVPRYLSKTILLISINAKNEISALNAIINSKAMIKYRRETGCSKKDSIPFAKKALEDMKRNNAPINQYFFSNAGVKLMYLDSLICLRVITRYIRKTQKLILPVHDSFIVEHTDQELIKVMMEEEKNAVVRSIKSL